MLASLTIPTRLGENGPPAVIHASGKIEALKANIQTFNVFVDFTALQQIVVAA
jgi:hypothetical protein